MRISDWSSDVCSSDLSLRFEHIARIARDELCRGLMDARAAARSAHDADQIFGLENAEGFAQGRPRNAERRHQSPLGRQRIPLGQLPANDLGSDLVGDQFRRLRYPDARSRSEEHTSELQSLMS